MLFQDDFNRADANLEASANWTQVDGTAGWGAVRSNALACLTSDSVGAAYQCPDTGSMAHYVQGKLSTVGAPSGPFLCVRLADRNNFLGVRYDSSSGRLEFYRRNSGTLTSMAPATITCVTNDVIRLEVDSGGGWIIKKNGVTADSGSSGTIAAMTSTRCGVVMRAQATNPWIDDFEAGSAGTPPPSGGGMDFPSAPTTGQVFTSSGGQAYIWNGSAWVGGGIGLPPTEQFFDLSGLSSLDIPVPAWAKGAHLDGNLFTGNANGFALVQISTDGTTFIGGTSYNIGGPYHSVTTPFYATQAMVTAPGLYLSYPTDNFAVPHNFQADINLIAPNSSVLITCRSANSSYRNTAPAGFETRWFSSYYTTAGPISVKKLRFLNGVGPAGAAGAGSYLRVKWFGDQGQMPIASVINAALPRSYSTGLWLSNSPTTPNSQIVISSGACRDDTDAANLRVPSGSGGLTVNFLANGANGLDTGTFSGINWYHVFIIGKADGTMAGLGSLALSPVMPSGYLYKRRLGSVRATATPAFNLFTQRGDTFLWTPGGKFIDIQYTGAGFGTVYQPLTLTVARGVLVQPLITGFVQQSGVAGSIDLQMDSASPDAGQTNVYAVFTMYAGQLINFTLGPGTLYTNSLGQIMYRLIASGATAAPFQVNTLGWIDRRGRDD